MFSELRKKFVDIYGANEEVIRIFQAAGRVNLIGEHIDYNGGKVFPAALSLKCVVLARPSADAFIKLAATTLTDRVNLDINKLDSYRGIPWGDYQAGVAYTLQKQGYTITPCELLYAVDIPFGSGLSSSAAIEVATALTLATFSKASGNKKDFSLADIALISQEAENKYAGVNCGIMDQFASALGKKDNAILLDCATLQYEYVPLKLGEYRLVLANTCKPRSLQESKYNERRQECGSAFKFFKKFLPDINNLCDVTAAEFLKFKRELHPVISNRAEHVIYENKRVADGIAALGKNDIIAFGKLLNESHESLKNLYEVTGAELDALAEAAQSFADCIGSRMTGAGFGGCTVSIVKNENIEEFIKTVGVQYKKRTGYTAAFYVADIEDGAKELLI